MAFHPNKLSFGEGITRLTEAAEKAGLNKKKIITSRHLEAERALSMLKVTNVPDGFAKWQLPVFLDGPSQMFVSYAGPDIIVPMHAHEEGDGIRVIMHGSIKYEGEELLASDWMFIPKGEPYEFQVGPHGAGMFYCYQCCCA